MRYFNYILFMTLSVCFVSCNTLPEGTAPDGPLIDETKTADDVFDGKTAVSYMITSLAMKCSPIKYAGSEKPKIINDFIISAGNINDLQMEVWRRLSNMNMIIPVSDMSRKPEYKLTSEINRLPERVNDRKKYSWIMTLIRSGDKKIIWNEQIEFAE